MRRNKRHKDERQHLGANLVERFRERDGSVGDCREKQRRCHCKSHVAEERIGGKPRHRAAEHPGDYRSRCGGGDEHTDNVEGVLTLWNKVKENVEGHKEKSEDFFEHIPSSLPPLEASYEIQKKLKKVGFDWNDANGVIDKVYEELQEVKEAIAENNQDHIEEEIGDLLFTVVNLSRFLKVRPNVALFRCNDKVKTRFQKLFDAAREKGIPLDKDHVDEMNQLWDEIKRDEKND